MTAASTPQEHAGHRGKPRGILTGRRRASRRAVRYRVRLRGAELARLDTAYDSPPFAQIHWRWSLRSDGTIWYRLTRTWYWQPVPHAARRREPALWRLAGKLAPEDFARYAAKEATAAQLLAEAAQAHGHYLTGTQPERLLEENSRQGHDALDLLGEIGIRTGEQQ